MEAELCSVFLSLIENRAPWRTEQEAPAGYDGIMGIQGLLNLWQTESVLSAVAGSTPEIFSCKTAEMQALISCGILNDMDVRCSLARHWNQGPRSVKVLTGFPSSPAGQKQEWAQVHCACYTVPRASLYSPLHPLPGGTPWPRHAVFYPWDCGHIDLSPNALLCGFTSFFPSFSLHPDFL